MMMVCKKDNSLRICLDPKDLNQAIQREVYPMPTVEEIVTNFSGAQVCEVVDVKSVFCHILLHE